MGGQSRAITAGHDTNAGGAATPAKRTIGTRATNVKYIDRHAVRLIIKNSATQEIAIVFVRKGSYYKLPGGGVEAGEDHRVTAVREAEEETGCRVIIVGNGDCFATTEEWRNDLHQMSYGYAAAMVKDTGIVALTEDEVADGLQPEWLSLSAALEKVAACQPTSELGQFIKERDLFLMRTFADCQGCEPTSLASDRCKGSQAAVGLSSPVQCSRTKSRYVVVSYVSAATRAASAWYCMETACCVALQEAKSRFLALASLLTCRPPR